MIWKINSFCKLHLFWHCSEDDDLRLLFLTSVVCIEAK